MKYLDISTPISNQDALSFLGDAHYIAPHELQQRIQSCRNFIEVIGVMVNHSIQVNAGQEPCDVLNSCDGSHSVCERFSILLLEDVHYLSGFLIRVKDMESYNQLSWLIIELTGCMWKLPERWFSAMQLFIQHPIIGPKFSWSAAVYVNPDYYQCPQINAKQDLGLIGTIADTPDLIVKVYHRIFSEYHQTWGSTCEDIVRHVHWKHTDHYYFQYERVPWAWKGYAIKKALIWRELWDWDVFHPVRQYMEHMIHPLDVDDVTLAV